MRREQLAINSVSTKNADLESCLAAYQAAGFRNVEFVLSHVKSYLAEGHRLADVRQLLAKHNLTCIGGFETPVFCFAEAGARTKNHQTVVENARLLAELGGTNLVVGTDGPADLSSVSDPLGIMAGVFAELAQEIRDTGVNLCIEFNWSPIVKSLRTAAEIARRSGMDNVGVLFDPAHYHCTPTKLDQLNAENIALIKHVHVDDMRDKPGELSNCNSDRALPGQGCLDLPALMNQIEQHGYQGYFSIEMFDDTLWQMPVEQAAALMYQSLLPLCEEDSASTQ